MRIALDIADAVAAELSVLPLNVQRRVLPEYELAELKELVVTVVPKSVQITNVTRQSTGYEVAIDIGIQQKVGTDLDAEVLVLSGVVSDIAAYLNRRTLAAYPAARFKSIANEPVYASDVLHERRVFVSVVTVTYMLIEEA